MRQGDPTPHPEAVKRERRQAIRFYAGLVIAAAGLVAVFALKEVYLGFTVAMAGAGIVPIDRFVELFKR